MVFVFLLLLHPHFCCCPNLSSYLRSRKHQTRQNADTRMSAISVIAKVLHQLHFHPHLQRPSFKSSGPSMPKWHQNACKTKLRWAEARSHHMTAQADMWMQLQHDLQGTNHSGISHSSSLCAKGKTRFLPFMLQRHNHKAYLDALQQRTGCAPRYLTQISSEGTASQGTES